ncbi:MAG: efflux RND transporter permease subunit [Flavobacteriales bacterium]|nr:efflux RND transporter permease subunit [Flavobacteriales bacterium]
MLNKIIQFSLNNRILVLFFTVVIMISGGYISKNMDIDVFPDLSAPTVAILTEAHGMATEEVERLVSYPIESSINGAPNIRRIRSSSARGFSIVWAEFEWGTDIYKARQIVSEKLSTIKDRLPANIGSPTMAPISSIMGEIMIVSIFSDSIDPLELRTLSDWTIRQRLLTIGGVAQVTVMGGGYKQYQILASANKMKYHNISLSELESAAKNSNSNASGGVVSQYGNQYIIRGEGKTTSLEDIGNSLIKVVNGIPIKIEDVAVVKIGESTKIGNSSFSGKDAVLLTIFKQPNANTLNLTEKIETTLKDLKSILPKGIEINSQIFRQADFIQASVNNLQKTLMEGAFFVCIILFLFLMNWRTTIISLTAIPVSLFVTIIALKWMGFTINTMSLGGMAIAIGALVDDAIIDVENIYKRLKENAKISAEKRKSIISIVYEASKEIRNSILIATLIIVVSFVPLFLLSGMEGKLLQPLGISFIIALVTSLFVAVTLTPVMSSYLLSDNKKLLEKSKGSVVERWLRKKYERVLNSVLKKPKSVIRFTAVIFFISIFLMFGLGRSFLPEFNEGAMVINVVAPPGISLEESEKSAKQVEQILLEMDEIDLISRRTGRAEQAEHSQGINASEIDFPFTLKDKAKEGFMKEIREKLSMVPGVNITIGQPISHRIDHMLSGTRANIAIKLFGTNLNELFKIGNSIKSEIENIDGLVDVNVEQLIEVPEINIEPNREMLAKYGITINELMDFIDIAFAGESVSQVYEGQKSFDLILRFQEEDRSTIEQIKNIKIDAINGNKIPLYYIADINVIGSPFTVNRENTQRKIVISANVSERDLRGAVNDIKEVIQTNITLPQNYHIQYGGQFESEEKASKLLLLSSILAILIIFFLLYTEFKDFKLATIVLLNLPLALIGGIIIVFFTSGIISIASTIGFISLFGIASRNGILLVSRYQVLLKEGEDLYSTILHGSLDRLNPILMTALTTGLALIPLALAGDQSGNEIQSPMAIVILGGLLSATLLNLILIPAIFHLTYKKK